MDKLGYTVYLAACQLKTGLSPINGLIVPSVVNPFYGNLAHLIETTAFTNGYQMMLGNSERDPESNSGIAGQSSGSQC